MHYELPFHIQLYLFIVRNTFSTKLPSAGPGAALPNLALVHTGTDLIKMHVQKQVQT